jgi:HPt (histidine-containing phosphotransfer) domain-containing protein
VDVAVNGLESLTVFNAQQALERLGGNRQLYGKLLADFARQHGRVTDPIDAAIEAGALDRARILVHTLKGMAGNLPATAVYRAAARLEVSIRSAGRARTVELTADLAQLRQALADVAAAVSMLSTVEIRELAVAEVNGGHQLSIGPEHAASELEVLRNQKA